MKQRVTGECCDEVTNQIQAVVAGPKARFQPRIYLQRMKAGGAGAETSARSYCPWRWQRCGADRLVLSDGWAICEIPRGTLPRSFRRATRALDLPAPDEARIPARRLLELYGSRGRRPGRFRIPKRFCQWPSAIPWGSLHGSPS